jgi:uncharacterized protein (DUF433 family)
MKEPRIVNRGDGPKIEGTRITVYTIFEYLREGESRDWIAALLNLSSRQVEVAMDYIREHEASVSADYEEILARIRRGNPPEIEAKLRASREKLKARLAQLAASKRQPS